jgi:HSP20 family protein
VENEADSRASGRGAFSELKEAVTGLFDQVVGLIPDFGLGKEFPRHELRVEDERYRVLIELPGFKREDIDVSVAGRALAIAGDRPRFEPPAGARMLRSERPCGEFELTVRLPAEVDAAGVGAQMCDGVLEVELPKAKGTRGRSIEVEDEGPMPWEEEQTQAKSDEPGAEHDG